MYRLPIPKQAPFAIGYTFEGKPHDYLPDVVGQLQDGTSFIAEAGMEDEKRQDRNLAKAEAARRPGAWLNANGSGGTRAARRAIMDAASASKPLRSPPFSAEKIAQTCVKGRKRPLLVETLALLLAVYVRLLLARFARHLRTSSHTPH
ncbi:hypothetical protein KSD_82080 [Ktedonobacter sp. SOSP1-85]|nr:hypothetical protein KSD_82080 [Ktedonobacter sp. SOSP1-85]